MKRAKKLTSLGLVILITAAARAGEPTLLEIQKILESKKFVELTHAFEPGIPRWSGFPDEKRETAYWYEKGRGSLGTGFFSFCASNSNATCEHSPRRESFDRYLRP